MQQGCKGSPSTFFGPLGSIGAIILNNQRDYPSTTSKKLLILQKSVEKVQDCYEMDKKNKKFIDAGYTGANVGSEKYFEDITDGAGFANTVSPWDSAATYNAKDVVSVSTLSADPVLTPPTLYVCIKDGTKSHPSKDRAAWVEDICDKSVCGCRLRFSDAAESAGGCERDGKKDKYSEKEDGLPFGGFPGVDPYEFK